MTSDSRLYFDWNATTRPHPAVIEVMTRALTEAWGNPASLHAEGQAARRCVEDARWAVAELVGAHPLDVTLTGGGTEASNLALWSAVGASWVVGPKAEGRPPAVVLSELEHPSVLAFARWLERFGVEPRWVRLRRSGRIDLDDLAAQLPGARLLVLQAVNGESGVVQPLVEAAALAESAGAAIHADVVQALGRLEPPPGGYLRYADSLTIASHKLRGPKGAGALATRPGFHVEPLMHGGGQERGARPGTQDPVALAGFAMATRLAHDTWREYAAVGGCRDRLEAALREVGAQVHGDGPRVPHVTYVSIPGWSSAELVAALDLEGLAVSGGAACASGKLGASPMLRALNADSSGAPSALVDGAIRLSLPPGTTTAEVDRAIDILHRVLGRVG